jgi:hypothetical protein
MSTFSHTTQPGRASCVNGDDPSSAEMANSNHSPSHNYEPIDLKFGEGDNVMRSTNPAEHDEDRFSDGDSPWW